MDGMGTLVFQKLPVLYSMPLSILFSSKGGREQILIIGRNFFLANRFAQQFTPFCGYRLSLVMGNQFAKRWMHHLVGAHELVALLDAFHQEVLGALFGLIGDCVAEDAFRHANQEGTDRLGLQQPFRLLPGDNSMEPLGRWMALPLGQLAFPKPLDDGLPISRLRWPGHRSERFSDVDSVGTVPKEGK